MNKECRSQIENIPSNVLVAVSGGADSMALFHMFYDTEKDFSVAHAIYGEGLWREKAFRLVNHCTTENSKQLWIKKILITETKGTGFESKARIARYEFFRELIRSNGYQALLTAHTIDDLAETVEIALRRKQGEHAVAAIPFIGKLIITSNHSVPMFRPFLKCFRSELRSYLRQYHYEWIEDPTNADPTYSLRNKIRLEWSELSEKNYRTLVLHKCQLAETAQKLVEEANQSVRISMEKNIEINSDKSKILVTTSWFKSLNNIELTECLILLFQYWNYDFGSVSGGSRLSFMKSLVNGMWGANGTLGKEVHYRITSQKVVFTNKV